MYRPGQILQVGGTTNGSLSSPSNQAITVDINGTTPVVRDAPNMAFARIWPMATVLPNGEVLVSNGSSQDNKNVNSALMSEMWNPDTRQFRSLRPQVHYRLYHSISLLLADGTVMVGGGGAPGPRLGADYQIYQPPYLFTAGGGEAVRPTYGELQRIQGWGNTVTVTTSGNIKSASLIRMGSVTHSFDNGQRFIPITTTNAGGNKVSFKMPANRNAAPPGYYMLFLLNTAGVPSVAKVVSLGGGPVPVNAQSKFTPKANSVYTITSKLGNKCLDVQASSKANGANVRIWDCNGTNAQKFRAFVAPNGRWKLKALHSGKCLDIFGPKIEGSRATQWDCKSNIISQNFEFPATTNGTFMMQNAQNNFCLEIPGSDLNRGRVNVTESTCNALAQRFQWTLKAN